MTMLVSFWHDESGQGLSEYAVILALVSVTMLVVLVAYRDEVGSLFGSIRMALQEDLQVEPLGKPGLGQGEGCPSVHGCNGNEGGDGT
jgi:Flp pilus assembly pilin Flp